MDIRFSKNVSIDLTEYFASSFPYGKVLTFGDAYEDELAKAGCRVCRYDGAVPEDITVIFACGRDNVELAKWLSKGKPLVLCTDAVYASMFDDMCVYDYHICRCSYPNAVFIDTTSNFGLLQASAVARAVGLYAESLGIVGSGLRGIGWGEAKSVLTSAVEDLNADIDTEELVRRVAVSTQRLSAVSGWFFRLAEALYPKEEDDFPLHATFFLYFSAVFAVIRFTKNDLCVILPEKDRVRTRILCDALKITPPEVKFIPYNPIACLREAKKYVVEETVLKNWLNRFLLTAGGGTAVTEVLLDNLSLATELTGEVNLYTILADRGYIDAITEGAG